MDLKHESHQCGDQIEDDPTRVQASGGESRSRTIERFKSLVNASETLSKVKPEERAEFAKRYASTHRDVADQTAVTLCLYEFWKTGKLSDKIL